MLGDPPLRVIAVAPTQRLGIGSIVTIGKALTDAVTELDEFEDVLTQVEALEAIQVIWSPLFKLFLVIEDPVPTTMPLIFQL